ncbi:hypothetical protein ACTSKR_10790 [Chitinibacteraceae bacterium HSL-7]
MALIIVGCGWLLASLDLAPPMSAIVALGLIAAGVGILVGDGINRSSVVSAPMLMAGGGAILVHLYWQIGWGILLPALMVVAGVLMLVSRRFMPRGQPARLSD